MKFTSKSGASDLFFMTVVFLLTILMWVGIGSCINAKNIARSTTPDPHVCPVCAVANAKSCVFVTNTSVKVMGHFYYGPKGEKLPSHNKRAKIVDCVCTGGHTFSSIMFVFLDGTVKSYIYRRPR